MKPSMIRWTAVNEFALPVAQGKIYTASLYLRSDQDGVPVKLAVEGIGEQVLKVGTQWKRHWLAGPYQRPSPAHSSAPW